MGVALLIVGDNVPLKQELLIDLDASYGRFRSLVEPLDEEAFTERWFGRWGVRQIVAHLAGWHRELGGGLERMGRGEKATPEGVDWDDVDGWNERFAASIGRKSKGQLLQELETAVARFKAVAAALPEERFEAGKTAARMVDRAGISHFETHAGRIEEWLKERSQLPKESRKKEA